jgi:hypothetical protein
MSRLAVALLFSCVCACDMGSSARPEPKPTTPTATSTATPTAAPVATNAADKFGAAIDPKSETVALAEVAKNPTAFANKTFTTTGTVSAVCEHRGCWMEIKDDKGEAHIKMAGHSFFVPRTASGKKARVQATLVQSENEGSCGEGSEKHEPGKGCKAEAEAKLGRPLAKLELVAQGVELL